MRFNYIYFCTFSFLRCHKKNSFNYATTFDVLQFKCQIPLILHHNYFLVSVDDGSLKLGLRYLKLTCKAIILASCVHFLEFRNMPATNAMQIAKHNITPALYQ